MRRAIFNRIAWLQGLTVLMLTLPLLAAGLYVWDKHQSLASHLSDIEPRYARLKGMLEREADFKQYSAQAAEQLSRLAYPSSQDETEAGNDAQQRIRSLFADSKLDIVSIQVLPSKTDEGGFDRIAVDLRVEGDLVGMHNALSLLASQTPRVLVDGFAMQTVGVVKPASIQRIAGQFSFSVLRIRP